MSNITIETITDGNIEPCRELCNELMALQKSCAVYMQECFDSMNFDTRMKKSFENALESQVILIKDDGVPVGYIFSTIDQVTEDVANIFPEWAPEDGLGFYPQWVNLPKKIGCLSNLYLREPYRGMGLGKKLLGMAVEWLEQVDLALVFISNGNDSALKFYLDNGFTYSHEVFGGFIKAAYRNKGGV